MAKTLEALLIEARACTLCKEHLPLGPRPIVFAQTSSPVLIIGQAPGSKVHTSGIPWDDVSGNNLRDWLGIDKTIFYDTSKIAIAPMGFCYPGKGKSGDLPPRPECAPKWHEPILSKLTNRQLTLVIGQYAQKQYLGNQHKTLTERVKHWADAPNDLFPLPHPSPRNRIWMKKNPWFETEVLPELKRRFNNALTEKPINHINLTMKRGDA